MFGDSWVPVSASNKCLPNRTLILLYCFVVSTPDFPGRWFCILSFRRVVENIETEFALRKYCNLDDKLQWFRGGAILERSSLPLVLQLTIYCNLFRYFGYPISNQPYLGLVVSIFDDSTTDRKLSTSSFDLRWSRGLVIRVTKQYVMSEKCLFFFWTPIINFSLNSMT